MHPSPRGWLPRRANRTCGPTRRAANERPTRSTRDDRRGRDRMVRTEDLAGVPPRFGNGQPAVDVEREEAADVLPLVGEVEVHVPRLPRLERGLHAADGVADRSLRLLVRRHPDGEREELRLHRIERAVAGTRAPERAAEVADLDRDEEVSRTRHRRLRRVPRPSRGSRSGARAVTRAGKRLLRVGVELPGPAAGIVAKVSISGSSASSGARSAGPSASSPMYAASTTTKLRPRSGSGMNSGIGGSGGARPTEVTSSGRRPPSRARRQEPLGFLHAARTSRPRRARVTGKSLNSIAVTMPKLPPPPRSAKKRSRSLSGSARIGAVGGDDLDRRDGVRRRGRTCGPSQLIPPPSV